MSHSAKAHPLTVVTTLRPFWFVLFLPVLQKMTHRFTGAWFWAEILLTALLLTGAVLFWRSIRVTAGSDRLCLQKGFFIRRRVEIPFESIVAVTVTKNPADALFRSATVLLSTEGGRFGGNFSYKLYQKDVKTLYLVLFRQDQAICFRTGKRRLLLTAAADSSVLTGWAVAVPILRRAGKLFGIALSRYLFEHLQTAADGVREWVPPIVNLLTLILLVGYTVSLIEAIIRIAGFSLTVGETVITRAGWFVRRKMAVKQDGSRAVILEQTPFMQAIRAVSVGVCGGSLGRKTRLPMLPLTDPATAWRSASLLYHPVRDNGLRLCPPPDRKTSFRFYRMPVLLLFCVLTVAIIMGCAFDFFNRFAVFLTLPILVIIAYYGHLCRLNRHGWMCFGSDVILRNSHGFRMRTVCCRKSMIGEVRLTQTPSDRRNGTCTVRIGVLGGRSLFQRVRRLPTGFVCENLENHLLKE